ncbi:MAG: glycosyltransferase family 1 protein [Candidatus Komeilibacteria bacterium]
MIIGIDATRANKSHKTGVEWYSYWLIRELIKLDPEITWRLYFNTQPEPGLQNLGANVEYKILTWPFKYLWTQIRLSAEMLFNPPDILFIPAQIIPVISPPNTVTTIHDVAYEVFKDDLSWKSRGYLRFAAQLAKRRCCLIFTVSEFSKKEIIKYYQIPAEKIIVTHLGITPPVFPSGCVLEKKNYLLYVGRLESKKNIVRLIEVFNQVTQTDWGKDLQLYLAGYPSRGWKEAQEKISEFNLQDKVKTFGWITEEEKSKLLAEAKVYVHLAKYEGFGFGPLEAMACGTPAVVNNAASLPEIVGTAAWLVNANDDKMVLEAIKEFVTNPNTASDYIQRGQQQWQRFTWKTAAEKTLAALKSISLQ